MIQQLLDVYPQELKVGMWTGTCTPMFTAAERGDAIPCPRMGGWMNERGVYNGISFHLKKSGNYDLGYNLDTEDTGLRNKPVRKGQILYDSPF